VAAPVVAVLVAGSGLGGLVSSLVLVLAIALGIFLAAQRPNPALAALPLNAACLILVVLPLVNAWWTDRGEEHPVSKAAFHRSLLTTVPSPAVKPDIWFLLVDGLGDPTYVEQEFGLDEGLYSGVLRKRGFRIPAVSFSNYEQTGLSLSATWNVAHIPALLDVPDTSSRDRRVLYDLIGNSRVLRAFRDLGYRTVQVPSSYPMTRFHGTDGTLKPWLAPSFVEFGILEMGVLPLVQPLLGFGPADLSFALRRRSLNFIFDNLPAARAAVPDSEPALVFSHIMAPHPPFVFTADGGSRPSEKKFVFYDGSHWLDLHGRGGSGYPEKYRDQAVYTMKRLGEAVDRILAQATRPTVIIVQGDHGPGSRLDWERPRHSHHRERFGIFNAWYLPPGMEADLPEGITAIATFPVLFETLYGIDLPVPQQVQLICRWSRPYIFFQARE
jgi:hypothetical protein